MQFFSNNLSLNKHIFQFLHFSGYSIEFDELIGVGCKSHNNFVYTKDLANEWKKGNLRHAIQMHPPDPFYLRTTPFSNKFPFFKNCSMQMKILHIIIAKCVSWKELFFIIFLQCYQLHRMHHWKMATLESSKYGSGSDADVIPDCDARDCPNNHCF